MITLHIFFDSHSVFAAETFKKRYIIAKRPIYQSSLTQSMLSQKEQITSVKKEVITFHSEKNWQENLQKFKQDQNVLYVEEDKILKRFSNDTFFFSQWALDELAAEDIWLDFTDGQNITVAVIDTGILPHPDLDGQIVSGADFISDRSMAADGDGRDRNPTDEGDWIGQQHDCYRGFDEPSSWHGTHVAGIVAAKMGNFEGVAGLAPGAKILPVRVLGKCGGYTSDIADAIMWAAGENITGMKENRNPAKVINLSLGGRGSCSQTMQTAIDVANLRGAIVVVAAGNDRTNLNYTDYSPANCHGVVNVGALDERLSPSSYSNYGKSIDIYAPGGDSGAGILSTYNEGQRQAQTMSYQEQSGTSMAAPYVAATLALMVKMNPNLYPGQYEDLLKKASLRQSHPADGDDFRVIDAYNAINDVLGESRDSRFQYEPSTGSSGTSNLFRPSSGDDDGGFGCSGIVKRINNNKPPSGGSGQWPSFLLGIILIGLLSRCSKIKA